LEYSYLLDRAYEYGKAVRVIIAFSLDSYWTTFLSKDTYLSVWVLRTLSLSIYDVFFFFEFITLRLVLFNVFFFLLLLYDIHELWTHSGVYYEMVNKKGTVHGQWLIFCFISWLHSSLWSLHQTSSIWIIYEYLGIQGFQPLNLSLFSVHDVSLLWYWLVR
jgi:hypothetical protein